MKNLILLIFGVIIGALAMYFYLSPTISDLKIEMPKGLISSDQIKTLDQAYDPRYQLISDSLVKKEGGDNRSSWYGLDEIRNYLKYAEKEANDLGYGMDGIRIYLGAHPVKNGEPGYTTMFFVPTGKPNKTEATIFNLSELSEGRDIPGGHGLDFGNMGHPPRANYPQ